jgi:short-subunit dehydrogenase
MTPQPFAGNVAIVTGASQGIGAEIAYRLAGQGARLVLAARHAGRLEEVAAACRARGGEALVVPTDITDEKQCKALVARTLQVYGRVDTLVNNAGRGYPRLVAALPDLADLEAEIRLNYLGTVYCTYHALPALRAAHGRIVGVSSFGALVGLPGTAGYNASKHAMRGFLNTLRAELIGTGVSVTVVYVGAVRTPRLAETMGRNVARVPAMAPARCAELIVRAAAGRKREEVLTLEGKLLTRLYTLVPGLLDRPLSRLGRLYETAP